VGAALIALVAISALLDEDSGLPIWRELRTDLATSQSRVAVLVRENEALRQEIATLEAEPAAIERAIREDLDLALPGEIVVRFTRPDRASVSPLWPGEPSEIGTAPQERR
jgi:cell division protein FtsB